MTTFFTADTHFGHANIIKHCNRPFSSVEEMDETMIQRWNERVKPGDLVYHLGDFGFHQKTAQTQKLLDRLHGNKVLLRGNHDSKETFKAPGWFNIQTIVELPGKSTKDCIVLCHYAMHVWNGSFHGSKHLFGHSHGALTNPSPNSFDIGVDCHDFYPLSLAQVMEKFI